MSILRKDPITGCWVVFIEDRRRRRRHHPHQVNETREDKECPFCTGREHLTPPEILAFRDKNSEQNGPGWTVRIIPDKFPILQTDTELDSKGIGLYDTMSGLGAHEIIIESNIHNDSMDTMSVKTIKDVCWAIQMRIEDLKKDIRLKYVLISKNVGARAGALMPYLHPHMHLIAYPFVPYVPGIECEGSKRYWEFHNRCIYCDIVSEELDKPQERIIFSNDEFAAILPFASRFPYETWIVPIKHSALFSGDDNTFESLAVTLKEVIIRMNAVLSIPPYNIIIHSSPLSNEYEDYYHWHIEVRPRISQTAGFEWGSGVYINAIFPEIAAKEMRDVDLKSI